jgi:hypothetical protein
MNKQLAELEETIMVRAIEMLDQEMIAKSLADKITKRFMSDFELDDLGIEYSLEELLTDESCQAGKEYSKAIKNIALNMAKSINPRANHD